MNLVKCNRGHFYDSERYGTCPHCNGSAGNSDLTMPAYNDNNDDVTVAIGQTQSMASASVEPPSQSVSATPVSVSLQDAVNAAVQGQVNAPVVDDDNKTVSFFSARIGKEPVVGWLVCITEEHFGEDFRLKSGRNFIGRGSEMDVSIVKDMTVSRDRHAIVVYEPRGNVFLVQPGDSKELCYLNDEVVLSPQMLNANDKLTVGKTDLIFIPCCTVNFNWDQVKKEEE